ncbi:MAG: hypothetical protein HY660_15760 [Armatimonadetes bacterium]|nr:hypothetical protein [Armatimonadota bacterium]
MDLAVIQAFAAALSGAACQRDTEQITQHYRSPGASGYHAATDYVRARLGEAGVREVTVERYPLDGETRYLGHLMPPAWEPLEADLRLLPERDLLVAYPDVPSCLPWWCPSTPDGGVDVDVVDVGLGLTESDYAGRDVAGKAVLVRHAAERPAWGHAVELARRHGAQGVINDYLLSETPPWRTRTNLPHAVQLMRLPPRWDNPWAITLAYPEAERLAARCRQGSARVFVRIKTKLFKGEGQNLLATIPGRDHPEESVFFIAHTSAGTKPCANCAAGPALMVEIARAISTLINEGKIPRPRRSIRFLFVAEGLGSMAYFHRHAEELPNVLCAICLDSVGHHQDRLKSSLMFYRVPDSVPSYVNDLGQWLLDTLPKEAAWPFKDAPVIPLVSFASLPYTPWSDNHNWNGMGVPAPLIMSWPDLYFHTQLLTADHTDPMVFHRAGLVLGALALWIADAGTADAARFARLVESYAGLRIQLAAEHGLGGGQTADGAARARAAAEIEYLGARDARAIESTAALVRHADQGTRATHAKATTEARARLRRRVREALGVLGAKPAPSPDGAAGLKPVKKKAAPPPGVRGLAYPEQAAVVQAMQASDPAANWESLRIVGDELWNLTDGRRTLGEIAASIGFEFGLKLEASHLEPIARGLEKDGYLRLRAPRARAPRAT